MKNFTENPKSTQLRVSVVIPAYNCEDYIAEAIDSALNQTYPPHEIIVVDDGSTDMTCEILSRYSEPVQLIAQTNAGSSAARNRGVKVATGDVIAFLDADDIWEPRKTELQIRKFTKNTGLVYSDRENIGQLNGLSRMQSQCVEQFEGDVYHQLLLNNFITTSSVIMPRILFNELGGFAEELKVAHDWDLWLRVAERSMIQFCDQVLVQYRVHSNGISKSQIESMFTEQERILESMYVHEKNRDREGVEILFSLAFRESVTSSAFAAANAGQWPLAARMYGRLIKRSPTSSAGYKGLLKCMLRRA